MLPTIKKNLSVYFLCAASLLGIERLEATSQTFYVTSAADDGSAGTLRYEITQSNANTGAFENSIQFQAGIGTITLTSPLPPITQSVAIQGFNSGSTQTISGSTSYPVFSLNPPYGAATALNIGLQNLVLQQGKALGFVGGAGNNAAGGGGGPGIGGGVLAGQNITLSLTNVAIDSCSSVGGAGGTGGYTLGTVGQGGGGGGFLGAGASGLSGGAGGAGGGGAGGTSGAAGTAGTGYGAGGGAGALTVAGTVSGGNGAFGAGGGGDWNPAAGILPQTTSLFGGGLGAIGQTDFGGGGGAALGGGLYIDKTAVVTINDGSFAGNSVTGGVQGSASAGNGGAYGSDIFIASGGSLTFNLNNPLTVTTAIQGDRGLGGGSTTTGGITKSGGGALTFSGSPSTFTGGLSVLGGTLSVSAENQLGATASSVTGGAVALNSVSGSAILQITGSPAITSTRVYTIGSSGATFDLSGTYGFSGPGQMTAPGNFSLIGTSSTGVLTLSSGSTLSGANISILQGTLIGSPASIGSGTSSVFIDTGATVQITPAVNTTYTNLVSGNGTLVLVANASGTTFTLPNNALSGLIQVTTGTLIAPISTTQVNIANNDHVIFFDNSVSASSVSYTSAMSGTGALSVDISNATLTLTNTNGYAGGTNLISGNVVISNPNNIGSGAITFSGGALETSTTLSLSNSITVNALSKITTDAPTTLIGLITGSATLNKNGASNLILQGANVGYAGNLKVNAGSITVSADNNLGQTTNHLIFNGGGLNASTSFTLSSARTLDLTASGFLAAADGMILTVPALTLTGGGILTVTTVDGPGTGTGTVIITGNSIPSFTGSMVVTAGSLEMQTSNFNNNITIGSHGTLQFNISSPGSYAGSLNGAGVVTVIGGHVLTLSGNNTFTGLYALSGAGTGLTGATVSNLASSGFSIGSGTTVNFVEASTETYTGTLAGSGIFKMSGSGLLNLTGSASGFTGTIRVSSGTLQGSSDSLNGNVVNSSNLIFNQSASVISNSFAGTITGGGDFSLTGIGTLNLNGNVNQNQFTVNSGSLNVNALATGPFIVESNGTLGGSGSIIGDITSHGSIAPGSDTSVGSLSVIGNVEQTSGSNLGIQVAGISSDLLNISGAYTIDSGASIEVSEYGGNFIPYQNYTVVSATGGVTGTFSSIIPLVDSPKVFVVYTSHSVQIEIAPNLVGVRNAEKVANVFNALLGNTSTELDAIIIEVGQQPEDQWQGILDQLQPAFFKGFALSQQNNLFNVNTTISNRLRLRPMSKTKTSDSMIYLQEEVAVGPSEEDRLFWNVAYTPTSNSKKKVAQPSERSHKKTNMFWMDLIGDYTQQNQDHHHMPFHVDTIGAVLAFDRECGKAFCFGLAGAYTRSHIVWKQASTHGSINSYYGSLYANYEGRSYYSQLIVTGAYNEYAGQRHIDFSNVLLNAHNSHGGSQVAGALEYGRKFQLSSELQLKLFDAFNVMLQNEAGFLETGANVLNLQVKNSSTTMLRNELGLLLSDHFVTSHAKYVAEFRASWLADFRYHGKNYNSIFVGTDLPFIVSGLSPNRNLALLGFNLNGFWLEDRLRASLQYQGQFGSHFWEHTLSLSLGYKF